MDMGAVSITRLLLTVQYYMRLYTYFCGRLYSPLGVFRGGFAGSYGNYIFRVLRNSITDICTSLQTYQQ